MIFLVLCPDFAFFDWFSARALLYVGSLLALPGCHIFNVPVFFDSVSLPTTSLLLVACPGPRAKFISLRSYRHRSEWGRGPASL